MRRKTTQEYIEECTSKGVDLPIDEYQGAHIKIKHKCSKCGSVYEQSPSKHLIKGHKCLLCDYKKKHDMYLQECKQKGLDLPIEEYKGTNTKIKHICKNNHIYMQAPHEHLQGQGCPTCRGNKRKTTKEYIDECKRLGIDLPIDKYINSYTRIKHRCSKCGNVYEQKPNNHLCGNGCPICSGNKKKTPKKYKEECKRLGYDIPIDNYINNATKIYHKCKQGHVYKQTPNTHLQGKGCPICNDLKKTTQEYIEECKELEIDLPLGDYINAKVKIYHKCKQGHVYKQTPSDHLQGYGCPICNQPKGEKFIQKYLDNHNVIYESQKRFNGLKDKTYLSYDFYLPKQKVLIEYQGKQHFIPMDFFGGEEKLQIQQYHDKLKRDYALNKGYTLLEPTYKLDTQEKVNKYLDKYL